MVCTRFRSWSSRTASQSVRPSDYEPGPDGVVDHATGRERQFTVLELPELFIRRVLGDHDRRVPNHPTACPFHVPQTILGGPEGTLRAELLEDLSR